MPRNKKFFKRKFGRLAEEMESYYYHLDLRPLHDLDDEGFAYLMAKVKGVNMLDLNETEIGNESIRFMTTMEYVKELRLKSCRNLDNGCIEYLNQLKSLVFLHLKNTGITIDGLLKLTALSELKDLMFSADEEENISEKMLQLKAILPGCNFVVNSIPYYFNDE